ncbi:MAG TPA: hypothetical protein P5571_03390 [Candidatus Krumholzibacteria bacterium]|nr:hypothetical protein [Candidatus Krumholzibacteria bacterium]HRX50383.1 hypothetical protein [Candidatus Krumholzibacteria bacterium]
MRTLLTTLVLTLCITGAAVAGPSAFAGLTLPLGDLADTADMGYHGGLRLHYPITPLVFSAGPQVAYHRLPGNGDDVTSFLELMASGRVTLPAGPTVFAGLGYALPGGEIGGVDIDGDAEFVWALGTGTSLMLLDLQAEWHHLGDADFVTISAGLGF